MPAERNRVTPFEGDAGGAAEPATPPQAVDTAAPTPVEYEVLRQARRRRGPAMLTLPSVAPPPTSLPVGTQRVLAGDGARDALATWDAGTGAAPTPRHRRRLILKWVKDLHFSDCLDAGCEGPDLLHEIVRRRRLAGRAVEGFGCHPTDPARLATLPDPLGCTFLRLDPARDRWPGPEGGRQFDLVVCPEYLARVPQWRPALANLIRMTRRYLLITVPAGRVRTADRVAGHFHHFDGLDLAGALVGHGLTLLKQRRWGFPVHSLYQSAVDTFPPDTPPAEPAPRPTSLPMRLVSQGLYLAFFSNDLFHGGAQHMVLAQRMRG